MSEGEKILINTRWLMDHAAKVIYILRSATNALKRVRDVVSEVLKSHGLSVSALDFGEDREYVYIRPRHRLDHRSRQRYGEIIEGIGGKWSGERRRWEFSKKLERTQLFRLTEVVEATTDGKEALLAAALFALRQSRREQEIPLWFAEALNDVLLKIVENVESPDEAKERAREFLGYLRWFYEASDGIPLPRIRPEEVKKKVNAKWLLQQLGGKP